MANQACFIEWLNTINGLSPFSCIKLAGDASFRHYFRIKTKDRTYVAMDASLEREKCEPYIAIAEALQRDGVLTPTIWEKDLSQGFLLLTDLGDRLLLHELNENNVKHWYHEALRVLSKIQQCRSMKEGSIPVFTMDIMYQELQLFKEWFLEKHLGLSLSSDTEKMLADFFLFLAKAASGQPYVFMHRDYHSANIMVVEKELGILDFQDAQAALINAAIFVEDNLK